MTADRVAEQALEAKVYERTQQLTETNAALEAATKSKTRFLAAASHDLVQPMNAARLFASALGEEIDDSRPREQRLLEQIDRSIRTADRLYEKIVGQVNQLRALGYSVAMIFVNTDLETAMVRNNKRKRSLPDDMIKKMWDSVQRNIGKFQNLFRDRMIIIDNSEGSNYEGAVMSAYRKISKWSASPIKNPIAKRWIDQQKKSR